MLHAGEGVFHADSHASAFCIVGFLARQEYAAGAFAVRDDEAGADVGAVAEHSHALEMLASSESCQASPSAVLPGTGRAVAITNQMSASMITCTFAENR